MPELTRGLGWDAMPVIADANFDPLILQSPGIPSGARWPVHLADPRLKPIAAFRLSTIHQLLSPPDPCAAKSSS
jgi:hypothetical protein